MNMTDFLIFAQAAPAGQPNLLVSMMPLVFIFVIFYFLLIRPQQKKAKQHREYLAGLKRGDYILTGGGIYGRIMEVHGDKITIEIAKDLNIEINRNFVSGPGEAGAPAAKAEPKGKDKSKD